jgi:hypothetical protein
MCPLLLIRVWEAHVDDASNAVSSLNTYQHNAKCNDTIFYTHLHVVEALVDVVERLVMSHKLVHPEGTVKVVYSISTDLKPTGLA